MKSMSFSETGRMLLSIQMIGDYMENSFWNYMLNTEDDAAVLSGCQFYYPGCELSENVVYFLSENSYDGFPVDEYAYIASGNIVGRAPHIRCIDRPLGEIANLVLNVFRSYHDFEMELNALVTGGGSLTDLCRAGEKFFNNPMYIHDNMFALIGLPKQMAGMIQFESSDSTKTVHVPLWLIDEFKFDESYRATFNLHHASVWGNDQYPNNIRSLFVNLWDGAYYCGRLLINELQTSIQPGQFRAAEYLADYAMMILRRDAQTANHFYRNFEDTFADLAVGKEVHAKELNAILDILKWKRSDNFLCIRLQSQDEKLSIRSAGALRSVLATELSGYFSFFCDQQLCILLNLSKSNLSTAYIQQRLAPQVRDSYMFGGISNPFKGLSLFPAAFQQAGAVLDNMVAKRSSVWLSTFEACAIDYIESCAAEKLPVELLAAPQLLRLKSYDREKGTEYYQTLRAWLAHERSIPKTSDALIVHRTTLTYRLDKLKELIPMDLDNERLRLYLMLSYHILDQMTEN